MKKWIRVVSMIALALFVMLMSPAMAATTVHAGQVLAPASESAPAAKLNVQAKSMVKDSTFTLRVYNVLETEKVSYKSSDEAIASIDQDGLITANAIGTATITVTVKDSNTGASTALTCDITVGPPAISIKLTLTGITLELDKKTSLKAILKPNTTAEIAAWYSLNPEIATVSATGKVTAKAVGETTIYAEIANGKFDKCVITVVEVPTEDTEITVTTGSGLTETNETSKLSIE